MRLFLPINLQSGTDTIYCALHSTSGNYISQKHVSSAEVQIPGISVLRNYFFVTEVSQNKKKCFQILNGLGDTTKVLDEIVYGNTVQYLSPCFYAQTVPKQLLPMVAQKVKFNSFHPGQHKNYSKLTVQITVIILAYSLLVLV